MSVTCRFVDGIDGATLLDLNDEVSYAYVQGSEFPLPEVIYNWIEGTGHGQRLASWSLGGNTITLKVCVKGTDEQDAYDKLNVLLTRLLQENTLEIQMWGADNSLFYHTYPATPRLPDWSKKYLVVCGYVPNITVEIPVDPLVHTSTEILYLVHGLGANDDMEEWDADGAPVGWNNIGGASEDNMFYHSGIAGCALQEGEGIREDFQSVDTSETHGFRMWAKEIVGDPSLNLSLRCYSDVPAITRTAGDFDVDTMLMDGTVAIDDLITGTAFAVAGVPTTAALLAATAPNIGAATYTSCTIPTATIGMTPGDDYTLVFAFKPTWAGDDRADHYLLDTYTAETGNGIRIRKANSNVLGVYTYSNTAAKATYGAVNGVNLAANVTHILVVRLTSANVQSVWLDGVALTSGTGTSAREVALNATIYVGSNNAGASRVEGPILSAIINRAVTDDEVAALSAITDWNELTDVVVSGLETGMYVTPYSGGVPTEGAIVEVAGSVTYAPRGPDRSFSIYEENTLGCELIRWEGEIFGSDAYALDTNLLDDLELLTAHNPADTNWHEVMNGAVVYPEGASLEPSFPAGTVYTRRCILNDSAGHSTITVDDMWFGSVERISDYRIDGGAMGLKTLDGDIKGNVATLADVHISAVAFGGPWRLTDVGVLFRAVDVLDDTHVYAVGSSDAYFWDGSFWADMGYAGGAVFYSVTAFDEHHVWIGAHGNIEFWDGTTFTLQATGIGAYYHGIHAITATNIIAVGGFGTIVKSINGTTWVQKVSGTTEDLKAVHAVDATHIVAVGDNGTILTSADGETWTARTSGTTVNLYGVYALDATHYWAVGENSWILFSDDGGVTWTRQYPWQTTTLRAVHGVDSTHVWAVGDGGYIFYFDGTTWVTQNSSTSENLLGVSAYDADLVFAVGEEGAILEGITTGAAMPCTDVVFGQNKNYSENWNPVLKALGATQTSLDTRRGGVYRRMVAAATEEFLFNCAAHEGTHMITAGVSLGAADANDTFDLEYKLQTLDGTDITTQTTTDSIDLLFSGAETYTATEFLELCKIAFPRLNGLTIPSQGVSSNANLANINQVITVTANAALATTLWLDYLALIPTWIKVEVTNWVYNTMILDSRSLKAVLASLDGSLDTAQVYDPTECLGIPKFTADPNGCNFTIVAVNNVAGDDRATFIPDIALVYNPAYLLVAS